MSQQYIIVKTKSNIEYLKVVNTPESTSFMWTENKEDATIFLRDQADTALKRSGFNAITGITIEEVIL